ncbi:hypothetical protein CAPTEDRAFT_209647 [Capitella teleta]|uniref:Uncharacterized protein n=1 Tax=Capitella teleta TaxID=283909 RepID=R7T5C3_CAPTE|nr:hypothetical protein CAPTEDRAFT_209647 [Capitella teleta]|eukprot:ELT88529.1 hypothetical protein CAPTEDRAFT_209647 [Capitella teleta]
MVTVTRFRLPSKDPCLMQLRYAVALIKPIRAEHLRHKRTSLLFTKRKRMRGALWLAFLLFQDEKHAFLLLLANTFRMESNLSHSMNMKSVLKRAGRLCNKAQQLSSFESKQEHGKRRCTAPVYLKDYDTDGSGSLPRELKVDMQVPSAHSAKKGKRFLEEDAFFHRPAPVMSEDED